MDQRERDSIAACQEGRLDAFDALYTAYVDRIYAYLSRRIFSREVAEDLTSITFMKALEGIRSFDPARGTFQAWLYRIARNNLIDHYRDPSRQTQDIETAWDLPGDEFASHAASLAVDATLLHAALSHLSPLQREVVRLRVWDGLSYADIAALTGKSEGNCKVLFCRALKDLRNHLPPMALLLLLTRYA